MLSMSASHRPVQLEMQRQELPLNLEEQCQDSFIEELLGDMEEVSQHVHMEVQDQSTAAPNWMRDRLRREPEEEVDPA